MNTQLDDRGEEFYVSVEGAADMIRWVAEELKKIGSLAFANDLEVQLEKHDPRFRQN